MTTTHIRTAPTVPAARNRPNLSRLTVVELRKLVDTRAGRWLLAAIVLSCLLVVGVQVAVLEAPAQNLRTYFLGTLIPIGVLLPVLGILAVTSEWSQRTALTTFALVPRRHRVLTAKLLAGAVAAVMSVAASVVIAAAANLVSIVTGGDASWYLSGVVLANTVVFQLINVAMGLAFGMALLNTPLAIVAYFVLPTVWNVLGAMVAWLADAARWLDFTHTMQPMLAGATLSAQQWAHLGTTAAVWVLAPMLVGMVRVLRAEVA